MSPFLISTVDGYEWSDLRHGRWYSLDGNESRSGHGDEDGSLILLRERNPCPPATLPVA
jgi:hypothetical protein